MLEDNRNFLGLSPIRCYAFSVGAHPLLGLMVEGRETLHDTGSDFAWYIPQMIVACRCCTARPRRCSYHAFDEESVKAATWWVHMGMRRPVSTFFPSDEDLDSQAYCMWNMKLPLHAYYRNNSNFAEKESLSLTTSRALDGQTVNSS